MPTPTTKLLLTASLTGALLVSAFVFTVLRYRAGLGDAVRETIIGRDAAVLHPVALQQLAEARAAGDRSLAAVLRSAHQEGMLAVALFGADGQPERALPASLLLADLPTADYVQLQARQPISRFHPRFPLARYFAGVAADQPPAPVLEILLPLYERDQPGRLLGFAQYWIDARPLAAELAAIETRLRTETTHTLVLGSSLIAGLVAAAGWGLARSQRLLAERNARLARAHFELTLAAKTSALGQIASHLIHGLQGPVAGLRAAMTDPGGADWQSAADYTARLQARIEETVALLGDTRTHTHYEVTGEELAATLRQRHDTEARERGVTLAITSDAPGVIDSHRGSLLCLIASNLIQNALHATPAGRAVRVVFARAGHALRLTVADEGAGIPAELREHLFEPGRSGRPGGTGLGLAISRLLARQIGATLALDATGPTGTTFTLTLPVGTDAV